MPKKPNLQNTFDKSKKLRADKIETLKQDVLNLKDQLATSEIAELDLDLLEFNGNQPRKSLFVVEEKIKSFVISGQITPVIVSKLPDSDRYIIFDGECRVRAAQELGWTSIKAFIRDYNPSTFDQEVLMSSICDRDLTELDRCEALINEIHYTTKIFKEDIPRSINAFLNRARRYENPQIKNSLEDLKIWASRIGFTIKRQEEEILKILYAFDQNPRTFVNICYSLRTLPQDVKQAMRDHGIADRNAVIIGRAKVGNKKLDITEAQAKKVREQLIKEVISENLTKATLSRRYKEATAPYTPLSEKRIDLAHPHVKAINNIKVGDLDTQAKTTLAKVLQNKLREITKDLSTPD